jgi:regulator of CtrA degradation
MALLSGMTEQMPSAIHRRLVDSLYVEAMLLADEARAYFDVLGRAERDSLEALSRVTFSCESLKVTTRLMHIIAWLLTQRAVQAGELTAVDALSPSRRLGEAPETEPATLDAMPSHARTIIATSIDLHRRVARLDASLDEPVVDESPARRMFDRLSASF